MILLLGLLVLWVLKMALPKANYYNSKPFLELTKAMKILPI
jgi:hypothetical protein